MDALNIRGLTHTILHPSWS